MLRGVRTAFFVFGPLATTDLIKNRFLHARFQLIAKYLSFMQLISMLVSDLLKFPCKGPKLFFVATLDR